MADDKQTGPGFGNTNWIFLAAAAVGAVYVSLYNPPLEGLRPAATLESEIHDNRPASQHVDARLWQDPLAAAIQHAKEQQAGRSRCCQDPQAGRLALAEDWQSHTIQSFRESLQRRTPLILGITVPGGPYPENGEARMRFRYAVVSALDVAKYEPIDEDHIGYVNLKPDGGRSAIGNPATGTAVSWPANSPADGANRWVGGMPPLPDLVPFEWFRQQDQGNHQEGKTTYERSYYSG